jgi:hypothetical protein
MLFKITRKDIFEDNPELKSIEEFSKCSSRDLKYIFFVYDYKSPFRNLKFEDRRRKCVLEAGFRLDKNGNLDKNTRNVLNGKIKKIEDAILKFKTLQHDQDREVIDALTVQIDQIVSLVAKPDKTIQELEKSIKFSKELPNLTENRKQLIEILDLRDMVTELESDDDTVLDHELSTLDKFNQSNGKG